MIKHIVMWKINKGLHESKDSVARNIKDGLENLNGKIDGLMHLEVGIDFLKSENSYDVVLVAEFINKQALDYYQTHHLHTKVATEIVKPVVIERVAVDYEY